MSDTSSASAGNRNVDFVEAVKLALMRNYANFNGRSSRGAFWWWVLATIVLSIVTTVFDMIMFPSMLADLGGNGPLSIIASLAILIPNLAVSVRRLHDAGHSGWWLLIAFTVIGILLLIYWYCQPGERKQNNFGPDVEAGR